jgi:uncharacterized short protein YbdD (DUF466 family)
MLDRRTGGRADRRRVGQRLETWCRQVLPAVRRVFGMPDYAAYADHARRCHPGTPMLTRREFYEEFVRARYENGSTRCC